MSMRYPGGLIASSPVNAAYPSGVWTQAQTQPYAAQNVWMRDQYWPNTTLLLQGNGTNGAQNNTFLDSSTNNFTITRNGNTTQGSFTPYEANGYWSNFFDGSGDWLSAPSNAAFDFGSGDFTIELWFFAATVSPSFQGFCGRRANAGSFGPFSMGLSGSSILYSLSTSGSSWALNSTGGTVTPNTWNHVAFVRSGTSCVAYLNGVSVITGTVSGSLASSSVAVAIATFANDGADAFNGYISNLRIVKGTAVYTSAFTPSAAPLTAITNTSLLTCQSNRFIDNSTNAFAITRNGDTSVQAFQPFPGATTWSGSVLGGSGYFDGNGDYLTAPASSNLEFGSGDFTIEFWWYTTVTTRQALYHGSFGIDWSIGIDCTSQKIGIWASSNGTSWDLINADGGGNGVGTITVPVNQWNHIAYVRSGTTWMSFVNGVRDRNLTGISGTLVNRSAYTKGIGVWWSAGVNPGPTTGYIQDFRILKGTALYTGSTYTVPTAPLTAISNTQLLCNFTNAGIFDSAMMNNLETVGNAQVSTSVVKYGTGSMAFDGSGDFLQSPSSPQFSFDGDITIEAWIYPSVLSGSTAYAICGTHSGANDGKTEFYVYGTGRIAVGRVGVNEIASATGIISTGTWYHVAAVRSGSTTTVYVNGVSVASGTTAVWSTGASPIYVAYFNPSNGATWNGYIDDLRITKGAARYIGNFTPPVARMPQQ